jgi:hypothetical protein
MNTASSSLKSRGHPVRTRLALLLSALAASFLLFVATADATGGTAFSFTGGVTSRPVVTAPGETFLKATFTIPYAGGSVILAGDKLGTANLRVGDILTLSVKHPDGSTLKYTHDFTNKCTTPVTSIAPVDVSDRFVVGNNVVTAFLKTRVETGCGGNESANAIWILP